MGLDEQLSHGLGVARGGRVLDRVLDEPLRPAPFRGAPTQLTRGVAPELELEKLAEQMVIAVPLRASVESDQEHIRAGELRKHRGRVLAAEDRVAQLRSEAPEHRGLHQEVPDLGRERRQNLGGQIVADMPSATGERPHPCVGVIEVAKPQRRQVQARGPALGALDEHIDAFARQLDAFTNEQLPGLIHREGQLSRADLGERPAGAQFRDADRRV